MKLEVILLIEDWKKNSYSAVTCYGVHHEIVPTAKVRVVCEILTRELTDWMSEVIAIEYLLRVVGEGLSESTDPTWYYTSAPSCHAGKEIKSMKFRRRVRSYQCGCSDGH